MVLTACSALSLVNRAFLPPSQATMQAHRGQLDASVGASGPHGFAVRRIAPSSEAPPASTASRPTLVTIRETSLDWGRTADSLLLFLPRRQAKFRKIRKQECDRRRGREGARDSPCAAAALRSEVDIPRTVVAMSAFDPQNGTSIYDSLPGHKMIGFHSMA